MIVELVIIGFVVAVGSVVAGGLLAIWTDFFVERVAWRGTRKYARIHRIWRAGGFLLMVFGLVTIALLVQAL